MFVWCGPGDSGPPWSCNYFITNNYSPLLCEGVQQFWLSCQLPVELSMTAIDLTRETKRIQAGSWLLMTVVRRDSKREEVSGRLPSRSGSQPGWISKVLYSIPQVFPLLAIFNTSGIEESIVSTFLMSHTQVQWNDFLAKSKPNNAIINNNVLLEKSTQELRNMKCMIK